MTAIVYDYPAIAAALRGDDWWVPEPKIVPLPIPRRLLEELEFMQNMEADMRRAIWEATCLPELIIPPLKTKLPEAKWRMLRQEKLIT